MKKITVYVDGAVSGTKHAGMAAVARTEEGYFLGWLSKQMPRMTNNEAEYHAAMLGLELAGRLGIGQVEIVSDSEVVVRQMRGISRVNSGRLKPLHQLTCQLTARFARVQFRHEPRNNNMLADALASEALLGRVVRMRSGRN